MPSQTAGAHSLSGRDAPRLGGRGRHTGFVLSLRKILFRMDTCSPDSSGRTRVLTSTLTSDSPHTMKKLTTLFFASLFALCLTAMMPVPNAQAQSVSVGADVMNRYVWRGAVFSTSASIQPSLSYSQSGFTVGSWGSFSMSPDGTGGDELDLYASYGFDLGDSGSLSIGVTDYFFPDQSGAPGQATGANQAFFDYDTNANDVSPHTIEPNIGYTGPESLPISLYAAINAYGTSENAAWLEVSYPFSVESVDLSVALGGTPNDEGGFYFTDGDTDAGITKFSLSASRSIEITDSFSLPIMGSYYLNPYHETSYFLFGISL